MSLSSWLDPLLWSARVRVGLRVAGHAGVGPLGKFSGARRLEIDFLIGIQPPANAGPAFLSSIWRRWRSEEADLSSLVSCHQIISRWMLCHQTDPHLRNQHHAHRHSRAEETFQTLSPASEPNANGDPGDPGL